MNGLKVLSTQSTRKEITSYAVDTDLRKTPWSESASELYQPSDRRLSAT
jgi:hypothetical protein